MKYSKEELKQIYYEARLNTINDSYFNKIKSILHEICLRFNYSSVSVKNVIRTLKEIEERGAIDQCDTQFIELIYNILNRNASDFTAFYDMLYIMTMSFPIKMNQHIAKNNIITKTYWMYLITIEQIIKLKKYNNELASALFESYPYIHSKIKESDIDKCFIEHDIFCRVFTHFLINIDKYEYQYQLIKIIIDKVRQNYCDSYRIIEQFYNENNKNYEKELDVFIEILLSESYQTLKNGSNSNVVDINTYAKKRKYQNQGVNISRILK